jgi:hypothetical protein
MAITRHGCVFPRRLRGQGWCPSVCFSQAEFDAAHRDFPETTHTTLPTPLVAFIRLLAGLPREVRGTIAHLANDDGDGFEHLNAASYGLFLRITGDLYAACDIVLSVLLAAYYGRRECGTDRGTSYCEDRGALTASVSAIKEQSTNLVTAALSQVPEPLRRRLRVNVTNLESTTCPTQLPPVVIVRVAIVPIHDMVGKLCCVWGSLPIVRTSRSPRPRMRCTMLRGLPPTRPMSRAGTRSIIP